MRRTLCALVKLHRINTRQVFPFTRETWERGSERRRKSGHHREVRLRGEKAVTLETDMRFHAKALIMMGFYVIDPHKV